MGYSRILFDIGEIIGYYGILIIYILYTVYQLSDIMNHHDIKSLIVIILADMGVSENGGLTV